MGKGFRGENSPFQLATAESVEDGLGGIASSMPQLQETFHVWACILAQILQNFLRSPLALPGSAFHKALELDRAMFARAVNGSLARALVAAEVGILPDPPARVPAPKIRVACSVDKHLLAVT